MAGLRAFTARGDPPGELARVERRLEAAEAIEEATLVRPAALWSEAAEAIADPARSPRYGGLRIAPQLGLIPLGPDPRSGLWEFAHWLSGEPAERAADGELVLTEATGVVLVLVPGGTYRLFVDLQDEDAESVIQELELEPFFLSKYELTQAQWLRMTGSNPSVNLENDDPSLLRPLESVSWHAGKRWLESHGLALPTEAQWEHAARGGANAVWWGTLEDLRFSAHVQLAEEGDDRVSGHVRAGSYPANPFGLHDLLGNVAEWCRDVYGTAEALWPHRPGDGERIVEGIVERTYKGGSCGLPPIYCTPDQRFFGNPEMPSVSLGLRPARALAPPRGDRARR